MSWASDGPIFSLLVVTAMMYASSYAVARRVSFGPFRAVDAIVLSLGVRYVAVCVCGWTGVLTWPAVAGVALLMSGALWVWSVKDPRANRNREEASRDGGLLPVTSDRPVIEDEFSSPWRVVFSCFLFGYVGAIAWHQRELGVLSTDALAYHLPTCVQWMQDRAFTLFECWYWNPGNTYGPLGSSVWMTWWMLPLGDASVVRFVQVEPLVLIFFALRALSSAIGATPFVAGAVGLAGVMARPYLSQVVIVKDDLFVAAFFLASAGALSRDAVVSRFAGARFGLCLGLMLSTKLTAVFVLPALLLMIDSPIRAKWTARQWAPAALLVLALPAGWFIRTAYLTGSPFYPIRLLGLPGIMTLAPEPGMRSVQGVWKMWTADFASLPAWMLLQLLACTAAGLLISFKRTIDNPTVRFVLLAPLVGLIGFLILSPVGDLRYAFGLVGPLFVATGFVMSRVRSARVQNILAVLFVSAAIGTQFVSTLRANVVTFLFAGVVMAALGVALTRWWTRLPNVLARGVVAALLLVTVSVAVHERWSPVVEGLRKSEAEGWSQVYGPLGDAWAFVAKLPARDPVAYANTYYVFPLQGFDLSRPVRYSPLRADVPDFLHLPSMGENVTALQTNYKMTEVMHASADVDAWLAHLSTRGSRHLFVAKSGLVSDPPEIGLAKSRPDVFEKEFENAVAIVWRIR